MKNRLVLISVIVFVLFNFGCATQKDYQVLKKADMENAHDWFAMANLLYQVRDYGFAMDYYEKIIENYPDSVYADASQKKLKVARRRYFMWVTQGSKFKSLRKIKQPGDYPLLKGDDKNTAENWLNEANLLYLIRDYKSAIDYYEKIIENYPDTAYDYIAQKKLKKAQSCYFKSIKNQK